MAVPRGVEPPTFGLGIRCRPQHKRTWRNILLGMEDVWTTGAAGGQLLDPKECRRRAEEADELARKSTDFAAQRAYEEIAKLWREMAERVERNKWLDRLS
jgi:hypothetical protein